MMQVPERVHDLILRDILELQVWGDEDEQTYYVGAVDYAPVIPEKGKRLESVLERFLESLDRHLAEKEGVTVTISDPRPVIIPTDLRAELDLLAAKDRRSLKNYIVRVLRQHVQQRRKEERHGRG